MKPECAQCPHYGACMLVEAVITIADRTMKEKFGKEWNEENGRYERIKIP